MTTSREVNHLAKKQSPCGKADIADFWRFSANQSLLQDWERLHQIKAGFPIYLLYSFRLAFNLQDHQLKTLFSASISTLERWRRAQKNLDPIASERLDRIATVSHLAEGIFEDQARATCWLLAPNKALGETVPIMLCETEIGAKQVRRILQALESGGGV